MEIKGVDSLGRQWTVHCQTMQDKLSIPTVFATTGIRFGHMIDGKWVDLDSRPRPSNDYWRKKLAEEKEQNQREAKAKQGGSEQ